jgi:hypothetical protein
MQQRDVDRRASLSVTVHNGSVTASARTMRTGSTSATDRRVSRPARQPQSATEHRPTHGRASRNTVSPSLTLARRVRLLHRTGAV